MGKPTDKEIAQAVIREWRCGTGMARTISPALSMLELLIVVYEDSFTLAGAVDALDSLSQSCESIKRNLIKEQAAAGAREEGRQ